MPNHLQATAATAAAAAAAAAAVGRHTRICVKWSGRQYEDAGHVVAVWERPGDGEGRGELHGRGWAGQVKGGGRGSPRGGWVGGR